VITLDACVVEAYFRDEPAAPEVLDLLRSGEQTVITAINAAEVLDRMVRVLGADFAEVQADIAAAKVFVSAVDAELAGAAADLRSRYYHRDNRPVSLADCCAAAHALDRGSRLATSDAHLIEVMIHEGGQVIVLPNSFGKRHGLRGEAEQFDE
jgi:predicted nucleic acid-binding protein